MANLMATVSDRGDEQRLREEDGMVNNLTSFLEVLEGMKVGRSGCLVSADDGCASSAHLPIFAAIGPFDTPRQRHRQGSDQ